MIDSSSCYALFQWQVPRWPCCYSAGVLGLLCDVSGPLRPACDDHRLGVQDGVAWPPIIRRELAVKLNNLSEAAMRVAGLEHQIAAHLASCGDPLRRGGASPTVPPPPPAAGALSERLRLQAASGRSLQASVQALDDTADDLSFMSDAFEASRDHQVRLLLLTAHLLWP